MLLIHIDEVPTFRDKQENANEMELRCSEDLALKYSFTINCFSAYSWMVQMISFKWTVGRYLQECHSTLVRLATSLLHITSTLFAFFGEGVSELNRGTLHVQSVTAPLC